jgi:hypothetical protein
MPRRLMSLNNQERRDVRTEKNEYSPAPTEEERQK